MVIIIVLTRPMRSPSTPKNTPPMAQPIMKIDGGPRRLLIDGGVAGAGAQQFLDGRFARQVEQLLRHGVEHPAHAGDAQHEPVVAGQLPPPCVFLPAGALSCSLRHEAAILHRGGHAVARLLPGVSEGSATASVSVSPSTTCTMVRLEAPFFTARRSMVSPLSAKT